MNIVAGTYITEGGAVKVLITFKIGEERQWFHTRHCEMAAAEAYLLQTDFLCYVNGEPEAVRGALYHYIDTDSQQQRELVVRFDDILYVEFLVPESVNNDTESNGATTHTSTGPLESVDERMSTGPLSSRISGMVGE